MFPNRRNQFDVRAPPVHHLRDFECAFIGYASARDLPYRIAQPLGQRISLRSTSVRDDHPHALQRKGRYISRKAIKSPCVQENLAAQLYEHYPGEPAH
jgi:hypothetical protein